MQNPLSQFVMPPVQLPELPITPVLPALTAALARGSAVLTAPPGSGKTTLVPLALKHADWLQDRKILVLEPRRLAARTAAARMATLLGEQVGEQVGYQVRFDRRTSPRTRIEVVTEGLLTRRLQQDPTLADTGLIVFDEFHERSLHSDLALALCLDLCELRDDLRLLVMSATLDTAPIARLLGGVPVIEGGGRLFPVDVRYLERSPLGRIPGITAAGVERMLAEPGDMLVFLPGSGEIRATLELLRAHPALKDCLLLPLFGDLTLAEQQRVILPDPQGRRRIILATSIAETSLTIEGVRIVIDSGYSRLPAFDPSTGLSRLNTVRVSQATATQRAGRAGRTATGVCLRLWTQAEAISLPPFHPPEIIQADLAPLALELALWGVSDPGQLKWLDPPRTGPYLQARELLNSLGALDDQGRITPQGKAMAALPLHPRLAHMVLLAREWRLEPLACDVAALLEERDPLRGRGSGADINERLHLLTTWRQKGAAAVRALGGDAEACRRLDRTARQWRSTSEPPAAWPSDAVAKLLIAAYPDRIAQKRPDKWGRYLLANGRGARLLPDDPLGASELLVAAQVDGGQQEGRIFLAASLDVNTLLESGDHLLTRTAQVDWDSENRRVRARQRTMLGALVLEDQPLKDIPEQAKTDALLAGIRQMGLDCLPWTRETRQLQARLCNLRDWQPEAGWPDVSDRALLADLSWLVPYLSGLTRAEQLARLPLQDILLAPLDWPRRQDLERLAPERYTVPSGSKIRIDYQPDKPPILAVRLQELFGLAATPTICNGRQPLLLHLLSPAGRPMQVTSDLAGFWENSYPLVKKDLKGRYPKHSWPDDPLHATPLRGAKPRPRPSSQR